MKKITPAAIALALALLAPAAIASTQTNNCPHPTGEWIALPEHYAANLLGEASDKIYLSPTPGAAPGLSYGLGGDYVVAMAEACTADGIKWVQVKFPGDRYTTETVAWVQGSLLRLR
ncbi:MAG: hypothetical protein DCF32_14985 [Leptolyngbya sp.]|nr:MAG: hypothetical protein DCF32_14985 [Leptolyngbya sp.]